VTLFWPGTVPVPVPVVSLVLCGVCVSDGASQSVLSTLLCPPGLECLLDAGQLVTHMGNLRHDYSQCTLYIVLIEICHMLIIYFILCYITYLCQKSVQ